MTPRTVSIFLATKSSSRSIVTCRHDKLDGKQKKGSGKSEGLGEENEEPMFKGYFKNILKNVKLCLNRIHIRFEDDYFSQTNPYAFGILCDQLSSYGSETEWQFGALESNQFKRVRPQYVFYSGIQCRDYDDLIVRETNFTNVRVYWKSSAEMFIPNSLWESTKGMEKQIFDAISFEDLRNMMKQSYADDNLVEPFSIYTSFSYNTRPTAIAEAIANKRSKFKVKFEVKNRIGRHLVYKDWREHATKHSRRRVLISRIFQQFRLDVRTEKLQACSETYHETSCTK